MNILSLAVAVVGEAAEGVIVIVTCAPGVNHNLQASGRRSMITMKFRI
jgi:hypothetical protein